MPLRRTVTRRAFVGIAITGLAVATATACEPETTTPTSTTTTAPATVTRPICFPVEGTVSYIDSWQAPRSNNRRHEGQDLMGKKMQRLVAAVDGTVTVLKTNHSSAGHYLYLKGADGWIHAYMHINNDTPGTDDGKATITQAFAPGLKVGSKVKKGEFIGYLGDSGNAEGTSPHLHFEMRKPDGSYSGVAVNAYPSLKAAPRCTVLPAGTGAKS